MDEDRIRKELVEKRSELSRLEDELRQAQQSLLPKLHYQVGAKSTDELIELLVSHASFPLQSQWNRVKTIREEKVDGLDKRRSMRKQKVRITDRIRKSVIDRIISGKHTAQAIAEEFGISYSAVNKIKQAEGLTRARRVRPKGQVVVRGTQNSE